MPENRFYLDADLEHEIELSGEELRHLQVMRRKVGDPIELVNGRGYLAHGTITQLNKRSAMIQIDTCDQEPEKGRKIVLIQALTRPHSLEYIIEKGTELGVSEFWLFPAVLSEKKALTPSQELRLKNLTISALKQCGRLYLPAIHMKPSLEKWKPFSGQKFFGDLRPEAPLFSTCSLEKTVYFFIGPEKGFAAAEVGFLEQALGAQGVKLHDNILRVDTAALVSIFATYLL
ncbi:MAG TPA: RsmE family RNA methyltransferase [Rhabdochlamydiaceae bacterium]|nr:RsmE family RNA methyltransferase [Rhabdochlamydiaceae bacterium]